MSADNWTTCPRCATRRDQEVVDKVAEVTAAYGKVSIERFDAMREELDRFSEDGIDTTFREDWEITGADEGVVRVRYRGSCTKCSLQVKFEHEQSFYPEA